MIGKKSLLLGASLIVVGGVLPVTKAAAATTGAEQPTSQTKGKARTPAKPTEDAQPSNRTETAASTAQDKSEADVIIVTGIRKSIRDSIDRKRNARQMVDVVTSEDAGKLPDNNVVEAMARITGITVDRKNGRADGFTIRGLAGVQTTINGVEGATAPLPGDEGRTLALESVPAELIKSIEVYKTRTADQIEGGIGGSVNIELRRPLDLPKGWTVAGGYRDTYAQQGKLWSPSVSLLAGKRFDTGIGEIGILLNGSWNRERYAEANSSSESPYLIGWDQSRVRLSLPADQRNLIAPYRAAYGSNDGSRLQKSLNAVVQWQASDQVNFVLEGSYFGEEFANAFSSLYVRTREDYYVLKNVRAAPSGVALGYDISNPAFPDGRKENFGNISAGFDGGENRGKRENYRANFEAHYNTDDFRIDSLTQYQWSNNKYHGIGHGGSYLGLTNVRVDFDSDKVLGNGPFFEFNVSPTDENLARIQYLRDNLGVGDNQQFSTQSDFWKSLDPEGLLRAAKIGFRVNRTTSKWKDSYRFAGWFDPTRSLLPSAIPGASTVTVTPDLPGGSPLSWVQLNNQQLFDNWADVTTFIKANKPEVLDGPGRNNGVDSLFATIEPVNDNPVYAGKTAENSFAAYATIDYAFKAVFPFDGNFGLRYVNTWASVTGAGILTGPPIRDANGRPTGQFGPDTTIYTNVRSNTVDLLPSFFAIAHLNQRVQLRGSYNRNIQRPGLFDLRNYRNINYRDPNATVYAGNPDLVPTKTEDFNLALEWFPAPGSIISVAAFNKKQTGFVYYTRMLEGVPELGGAERYVEQPRNAGPGKTQGLEFQATGFLRFLPGFLRNFGATANATWIPTAEVSIPNETDEEDETGNPIYELVPKRAPFTSRWTYNLIGYYETPQFSARVAYNWRSKYQTGVDAINDTWVQASYPTKRLDAAVNYTPVKFLTLSIEGQNLLANIDRLYYFRYPELPVGLRAMSRKIIAGARFRF